MKTKPVPVDVALAAARRRDEIKQNGGDVMPVLITLADAKELANVKNVETVRRWVRSGKLKAFTKPGAGRQLFVDKSQVQKFLEFVPAKK